MRCPGFWHLHIVPYLQYAQTPRVVVGFLMLAAILCLLAIGVIETRHIAGRISGECLVIIIMTPSLKGDIVSFSFLQ